MLFILFAIQLEALLAPKYILTTMLSYTYSSGSENAHHVTSCSTTVNLSDGPLLASLSFSD